MTCSLKAYIMSNVKDDPSIILCPSWIIYSFIYLFLKYWLPGVALHSVTFQHWIVVREIDNILRISFFIYRIISVNWIFGVIAFEFGFIIFSCYIYISFQFISKHWKQSSNTSCSLKRSITGWKLLLTKIVGTRPSVK